MDLVDHEPKTLTCNSPSQRGETFFNVDCRIGAKDQLDDNSIDLIVTDPPYGIQGESLHKHYNRNEGNVVEGYVEVDADDYGCFTEEWVKQAARVLRPGGRIFIVSGYSRLADVLEALEKHGLQEVSHIIWKYNFGVWTTQKFVSSHYHILFYEKPGVDEPAWKVSEQLKEFGDVWEIQREYQPGQVKNKNQLPRKLLERMIGIGSAPGDMVCDFFLGSFSTARVAREMGRRSCGFEINQNAFKFGYSLYLDESKKGKQMKMHQYCKQSAPRKEKHGRPQLSKENLDPNCGDPEAKKAFRPLERWVPRSNKDGVELLVCRTSVAPKGCWFDSAREQVIDGGSIFLCIPPSQVLTCLREFQERGFEEINHIIWKTKCPKKVVRKDVPEFGHEHILFYAVPGGKRTFNTYRRFKQSTRKQNGGSKNYADREDVWIIYWKPGADSPKSNLHSWQDVKEKIIAYCSSNESRIEIQEE